MYLKLCVHKGIQRSNASKARLMCSSASFTPTRHSPATLASDVSVTTTTQRALPGRLIGGLLLGLIAHGPLGCITGTWHTDSPCVQHGVTLHLTIARANRDFSLLLSEEQQPLLICAPISAMCFLG